MAELSPFRSLNYKRGAGQDSNLAASQLTVLYFQFFHSHQL